MVDQDQEMKFLKRAVRWIGGYAALSFGLIALVVATAPNGRDHGWHLYLTLIASMIFNAPFVLAIVLWAYFEVRGFKKVRFVEKES